jgi:beta-glucosidase
MGGAESGNGLADVLFGDLNPSGHLPYVWGTIDQYPAKIDLFGNPSQYDYNEGLFVGQRWFDLKGYAPIWPFGYGLSYTSFSFSDLSVSINDDGLTATFKVKNTGNYDGDVVAMLFLKFPDSVKSYPSKLFKGFDKQFIKKGETKSITIFVDDHGLSYYNVEKGDFERPSNDYVVYIGTDARNILLTTETSEWNEAITKANKAMENLNNEEKFNLLYGIQNLDKMWEGVCVGVIEPNSKIENFRGMCLQDGPAGVRASTSTQSWQAQINTASTFNRTLWTEYGKAYGNEFRAKGINVALGPAMNILRSPIAGRIWESYSEDPFLSGEAATYIIKAIQSTGVIACAKHYVANDQETNRKNSSSNIPEQALWEIYLEPFYRSVKDADVGSVMSSYNDVNGTHLSHNKRLLQDILKDKIGFKGFVMSDWWAIKTNDVINFNNGEDMNMPGGVDEGERYYGRDKGHWSDYHTKIGTEISQERLDDAVRRVLSTMYRFNQLDSNYPDINLDKDTITDATKKLNREAAAQSNVLLKNENNALPLSKSKYSKIAIIGNDAFASDCNKIGDCSCKDDTNKIFKGHLGLGYGSGTTTFKEIVAPYDAIKARADIEEITIVKAGENLNTNTVSKDYKGNSKTYTVGEEDIDEAKNLADANADIKLFIIFLMADSGEQYIELEKSVGDRYDMDAWHNGNELVTAIADKKTTDQKILVVINAPGPINVPWLERVDAIVFSGMGGAESGNGLVDVLFGDLNPSGHLPYVWGEKEQYPADFNILGNYTNYDYSEGVFIGQRWFDKKGINPKWPFGFGLSYTTFEFSGLTATYDSTNKKLVATFSVENKGTIDGDAVPMLFLHFPDSIKSDCDGGDYPNKLFKGFEKVLVKAGEKNTVTIEVDEHALSYYSVSKSDFVRPSGTFKVYIGKDASDSALSADVTIS